MTREIYCASLVFVSVFLDVAQKYFPVNEMFFLTDAESFEEAEEKSVAFGTEYQSLDGKYWIDDIESNLLFKGIRDVYKRPEMAIENFGMYDGEVWDNQYIFESMDDVENFVRGGAVLAVLDSVRRSEDGSNHELLKRIGGQSDDLRLGH